MNKTAVEKQIKVLQVNKLYYPVTGGVERVVQQIAEGLKDRVDMKVLVCRTKGGSIDDVVNGVAVRRSGSFGMAFSMPVSFSFFSDFRKLTKDADIVHIHMPFPLADVAALLSGYKGKIFLWWHSDVVKQKKILPFYKPFMHWLLRRADRIIVATRGHVEDSLYLPPFASKCTIIPYGVDPHILLVSDVQCGQKLSDSNKGSCRILYVGRLVYYKGCDVLLDAFAKVHGARLVMVGSGPLEEQLKQQAERLGVSDGVDFKGTLSEDLLMQEFASCDFFVLPSVERSEAFGLVQIEAMSFGKPVVNTKLPGGVPYVSLDGATGITVPPGNSRKLAAAMQKLVDDSDLRGKLGAVAYKRAREEFSMDVMLERLFKEYEKALNER